MSEINAVLEPKPSLAIVLDSIPHVDEVRQLIELQGHYKITIITGEDEAKRITSYRMAKTFDCIALPTHASREGFLPGLEGILGAFQIVILKGRVGVFAYQVVRAKWKHRFRLIIWEDNALPFPSDDSETDRAVREEVTNASDVILVNAASVKHALTVEGVAPGKIVTCVPYLAPKVERSKATRARYLEEIGLSAGTFVVGYLGPVEWNGGLSDLFFAVKELIASDSDLSQRLRIMIAGSGMHVRAIKRLALRLQIDQAMLFYAPSGESERLLLAVSDLMFYGSKPTQEQYNASVFPILNAMSHGIPLLACRSGIVEETVGKHRFDYCDASISSLAKAIRKARSAPNLAHDMVAKNLQKIKTIYTHDKSVTSLIACFNKAAAIEADAVQGALDFQIAEIEKKVYAKQFLSAIDLIEPLFRQGDLPIHYAANLYRLMGDCFTKLGDYEGGKRCYTQAIDRDAYMYKAHIGLGTVNLTQEKYDLAVIHFQKSVTLAPNDEMANFGLGLAFQGMEELEEANKWVKKALECNPENTAALYTIVKIAYEQEKYADAENSLRAYLERRPNDSDIAYTLAAILYRLHNYTEVVTLTERMLAEDPNDKRSQVLLRKAKRSAFENPDVSNA